MKSYTDIEQSKKLAEILPLESADMRYEYPSIEKDEIQEPMIGFHTSSFNWFKESDSFKYIPCWSLAALLSVLPNPKVYQAIGGYWCCECWKNAKDVKGDESTYIGCTKANNPIDACYEMIIKLNGLKIL